MAGGRLGDNLGLGEDLIQRACSLAAKAIQKSAKKLYVSEATGTSEIIFAFAGSSSAKDWFRGEPFGETKVDLSFFPSLRSIGNDETAIVNEGFMNLFKAVLTSSSLRSEVEKAVSTRKRIVFAGRHSGGPLAVLTTIWFLDKYMRSETALSPPHCITFGSPLVGDRIFPHALNREKWARLFTNFVGRHDIIPLVMLSPVSSINRELEIILGFFDPKSPHFQQTRVKGSNETKAFYMNVLKNAASVASFAACHLMGSTNPLLDTIPAFVKLSPYRPFGRYIFYPGNGKLIVVENSDAILQILFYCFQLSSEAEFEEAAQRSLYEISAYGSELKDSLVMEDVVYLNDLNDVPLSSNGTTYGRTAAINAALNDLGLSTRARICLKAAQESENQKLGNQKKIDSKKATIRKALDVISEYRKACEDQKVGYYNAFKIQKDKDDFTANVKRLELAGVWDEIVEMLKRHELPDGFETREEWVELGTKFRRLVEPLDIANYYRHGKDEDTGIYLKEGGRPKRYKYTQRWREHAEKMETGTSSETVFWAKVEEMKAIPYNDVRSEVLSLERDVLKWVTNGELGTDVFFEGSTFVKWWKTLPEQHRSDSCLKLYMRN